MKPSRDQRKLSVAIETAVCGVFGTLILSQFPAPLSYILIAVGNYGLIHYGFERSMEARHLHIGSLVNRLRRNQREYNSNAIVAGLVVGGFSTLPLGGLLSCCVSGLIGFHATELINWQ